MIKSCLKTKKNLLKVIKANRRDIKAIKYFKETSKIYFAILKYNLLSIAILNLF